MRFAFVVSLFQIVVGPRSMGPRQWVPVKGVYSRQQSYGISFDYILFDSDGISFDTTVVSNRGWLRRRWHCIWISNCITIHFSYRISLYENHAISFCDSIWFVFVFALVFVFGKRRWRRQLHSDDCFWRRRRFILFGSNDAYVFIIRWSWRRDPTVCIDDSI